MKIALAFLAGLLCAAAAQAQQVPNPATAPLPHNTALKAAAGNPQGAIRLGFAAAGDGGYQKYNWSPANCLAADDGAQVQPTGTGCWLADIDKAQGVSAKIWGATGDNATDDGPALRKACAWALTAPGYGGTIMLPSGVYRLLTLDPRDKGALYTGTGENDARACSLVGSQSSSSYPAAGGVLYGNTVLRLGDHLNRPLLYIPRRGSSPHIKYLTLDGNGSSFAPTVSNQDGWAGGPSGGRLFVVQSEDELDPLGGVETGPIFDDVVIMSGHNGNVYNGAGRSMWSNRLWSNYSGQVGHNDCSVVEYGTDTVHIQPGFGVNQGCGLYLSEGAQHTVYGGAMWNNTAGLAIAGLQVSYANLFGTNFQYNTYGMVNYNQAPFAGTVATAVTCIGCVFDGNTQSDVYISTGPQTNKQMKLVAPSFAGNIVGGAKPVYNIEIAGTAVVEILTPSLSSSGVPYATAWSNAPASVKCLGQECPP